MIAEGLYNEVPFQKWLAVERSLRTCQQSVKSSELGDGELFCAAVWAEI